MALSDVTKYKIALLKRGLSQRAVSRQLNISDQYLCDMVMGRRRWHPRFIAGMEGLGTGCCPSQSLFFVDTALFYPPETLRQKERRKGRVDYVGFGFADGCEKQISLPYFDRRYIDVFERRFPARCGAFDS
jgi:hypothetical protein